METSLSLGSTTHSLVLYLDLQQQGSTAAPPHYVYHPAHSHSNSKRNTYSPSLVLEGGPTFSTIVLNSVMPHFALQEESRLKATTKFVRKGSGGFRGEACGGGVVAGLLDNDCKRKDDGGATVHVCTVHNMHACSGHMEYTVFIGCSLVNYLG